MSKRTRRAGRQELPTSTYFSRPVVRWWYRPAWYALKVVRLVRLISVDRQHSALYWLGTRAISWRKK